MNSSNQGNSQGNSQESQQGSSSGAQQRAEREDPNFILVDFDEGFDIGDEQFILGEVRRADRARNRQSAEEQQQGGQEKVE
ncbi:hypothetical protein ACFDR9_001147 [Janthinobacterium sp. CG_23.3]|uniref:hypothetical protein n=1 Tax=Janthinobacterium sp. CG_23.3 TaxID=3349634 RepID=UPI0038D384D3